MRPLATGGLLGGTSDAFPTDDMESNALLVSHAELSERVELRRQELSDAIDQFEISIEDPMDVRKQIATRPWTFMAAAVLIGFWLGTRKS